MKQRPARASVAPGGAGDERAARAAAQLAAGRFKEAIESYRQLLKAEPRPEWRRALAEAYVGRADSLAGKGMYKEAAAVLDNADAAGGTAREPLLHLACLVRAGDGAAAARLCGRYLADGVGTPDERERIADLMAALWLTGHPPPQGDAAGMARAHAAADKALAGWLDGSSAEEVEPLTNAIPLRSPFKSLRFILKALVGAAEDAERRSRQFALVPATSAFAALARAADLAMAADAARTIVGWDALSNAARSFIAEVGGQSAASAKLLGELVEAERRGPGPLLDFLVRNAARFPADEVRAACFNLLPRLPSRMPQVERQFGPLPPAERHRILALAAEIDKDWDAFQYHWLSYAEELERSPDPDAAMARAVVYEHLAKAAAAALPQLRRRRNGDEDKVARWLEAAVAADPTDRGSLLALIARLRETCNNREQHRWADLAVQRFPGDAAVLLEAMEAAAERGAFRKAADIARKLLALDPINGTARQRLIDLAIAHARKKMAEGRPDLAQKALAEATRPNTVDGALDLVHGLVALHRGEAEQGWALLRGGVERLGGGVAGWLRAVLEARAAGLADQQLATLRRELAAALRPAPRREDVIATMTVLNRRDFRHDALRSPDGLQALRRWLGKGRSCIFSAAEFESLASAFQQLDCYDLLMTYAAAGASREPGDPAYTFYGILARTGGRPERVTMDELDRLRMAVQRAGEQNDNGLAYKIIRFVDHALADEDEDEDEDDDLDDLFDEGPDLADAEREFLAKLTERAAAMSLVHPRDKVVATLLRDFLDSQHAKGVPREAVHALVELIVATVADGKPGRGGGRNRGRR